MARYVVNRPDEEAMRRILARTDWTPAGTIFRLAWQQGLQREEITELTWAQVSFLDHAILLPDRKVPLCEEVERYLESLHEKGRATTPHVVYSERFRKKMFPQAVSRIARRELDAEGQTEVRLVDLRHDYVIRQAQEHDWAYVAQVTGVEIRTLQMHFSDYVPKKRRGQQKKKQEAIDEFSLWKVLQAERDTPAGLALWLIWQMGLSGYEIISLTWDQVDFEGNVVHLADRDVPLTSTVRSLLRAREENRDLCPNVLISEHAKKPIDLSRLSRITRSALIRGGMDQVTLKDIWRGQKRSSGEIQILEWVRVRKTITKKETMALLDLSPAAAYARLRRMADEKKLVRVGARYYLPGTVVPPEEHEQKVLDFVEQEGFAYRQDIANILHIQDKQSSRLLKQLVEEGKLLRIGQRYYLEDA